MDSRLSTEAIHDREVIDQLLSRMPTHCPGIIQAFYPNSGTVDVIPAIKMKMIVDGVVSYIPMPKIINCPVDIPYAMTAGWAMTIPISAGDDCQIHFSQRCIDNWVATGGIVEPETCAGSPRHHSLTDAIVTVGPSRTGTALVDWLANGIELRNKTRSITVTLTENGVQINGECFLNGNVTCKNGWTGFLMDALGNMVPVIGGIVVGGS